jgi:hypothetical protein
MLSEPFFVHRADPFGAALAVELSAGPAALSHAVVSTIRSKPLSMLASETLAGMHLAARSITSTVVEIGAYVGGATVVLLDGASRSGAQVITIEEPVRHSHPQIPTENSINDLKKNLVEFGPAGARHRLLCGCSFESWVLGELHQCLLGDEIGFFACDADGFFDRDLAYLAPFMAEDCLIMIDDYAVDIAKSTPLTHSVDRMITAGIIEAVAHLPWGTLFARLKRRPTRREIASWLAEWAALRAEGNPYAERLAAYRDTRDPDGSRGTIAFDERQAFWKRAAAWKAPGE